jgi:tetratricopeptide (TPR) repeat protein
LIAQKSENAAYQLQRADLLVKVGKYHLDHKLLAEAFDEIQEALQIQELLFGFGHATTISTASNLAVVLIEQRNYADAESILKRVLGNQEQTLHSARKSLKAGEGSEIIPDRPMPPEALLDTVYNIGLIRCYQGRPDEAESMFRRALAGYEEILGLEGIKTLSTLFQLGKVLHEKGRIGDGEAFFSTSSRGEQGFFWTRESVYLADLEESGRQLLRSRAAR